MAMSLPNYYYKLYITIIFLLLCVGDCSQMKPNLCDSSCADFPHSDFSYQKGVRYTYRYTATITTSLHGSNVGRNGLALDCVVDIDVVSKCHLIMQVRNPKIKRLSPLKEHSVQRLKSLRESLERTRLKFSLQGGKVRVLCLQEGEQVWALNIKRAFLSMLQTSHTAAKHELEKETDVHGTCTTRYERRGQLLLKNRDLKQCQQSRLAHFWPHSVAITKDAAVQSDLRCNQRHGPTVMEEVNCTEVVSIATWSKSAGLVKTQTVSTVLLLRAQPGTALRADSLENGIQTDLQFENEGASSPGKGFTPHQAGQTARMLCSLTADPELVSRLFLQLAFQLRDLSLLQLKTLWQEASFKCRNDWQPLLDALPACGSENCITLLSDLVKNEELEEEEAQSFLTTIALIPHPSPQILHSINALVEVPAMRSKALLAASSLVYKLCQSSPSTCRDLSPVQTLIQRLEDSLRGGCSQEAPTRVKELIYVLKSVGNSGLSLPAFIPLLNRCARSHSAAPELKLAAIHAFRRFCCSADRSVLLQLYGSSQEDPEVRIAAYQQLMRCPNQNVFEAVKMTLRNETSGQVGSYVWSHLTSVLRSEDPMKQTLIDSLPDDIISRDFEAEFLKYSSYADYTIASGMGITNVETSVVFSPKSFLPRSVSANLTVYFQGRASNLLEMDVRVENAEPLLKDLFGHGTPKFDGASPTQKHVQSKEAGKRRRKTDEGLNGERDMCLSSSNGYLNQARAMLFGRRNMEENKPKCWVGLKVFGNELSVFTCEDLSNRIKQLSLSVAGLAVKLLKGHEVQLNHRAVPMTDELVLPSLSGLPIKVGINMTSLLSLRLKGNTNYRDISHFSLTGYIKPNAYVGLSARMGVDGALGQATVEWMSELRSSTSLDGSAHLQEGQDLRVTLNTPEDVMDIISLSSQVFQQSGDHRDEIKGPKSRVQKTSCTPKTWSKMVGWQLCSNASYPHAAAGFPVPPSGPMYLSLRLLKLDRGLHYYLLEAAYSLLQQRGSWLPGEASLHFLLATPQSSIPRDTSFDLAFNSHRLLLRVTHPLKTILLQGQLEQERNIKTGKLELLIDGAHYYIMGLIDTHTQASEHRVRYHFEAKMDTDQNPMILTANITRGLGRKTSFSATLRNFFRETALLTVALERRWDSSSRQYSVEAEMLLPGVVGSRLLGLMEQKGSLWSSALRLKYGLGGEARNLHQECYTSQRLRSERHSNLSYLMRADHEFYCSNTDPINHKLHLRHEESPSHVKSSLDMSYGKHWDEMNNKRTLLLSQSFKNQSTLNHTSYTLEFTFQIPEKNLNYRTQLMHSLLRHLGSESSTHLKINYNNLMPLVAGLHWKTPPKNTPLKKWEGTFNMDTPWLYIYTVHKLRQHQRHTLQLTSELTASKWLTIRNLILESSYRDRGREKEGRLKLYSPAVTYLQAGGWGMMGKRIVKASCFLSSPWTDPLTGDISLEALKYSHTLLVSSSYGKRNISLTTALNTVDKKLKKRQVILRMTLSEPKNQSSELELEGRLEELRKDKEVYQKIAMLQFRQPFQTFPPSLLLRETFTIDLLKGLYILESRAGFQSNREVIHNFTIGYQPTSPFVCSTLIHPFSTQTLPSHTEICVTLSRNETQKSIQGRLRVDGKEKLSAFGQVELNPLNSTNQELKVRANVSHQLQLQLPSSAIVEGDVCWNPKNNTDFDYLTQGRVRIERQECQVAVRLSGTSGRVALLSTLRHPFKSKIPKTLEAKATADIFTVAGRGSSSVQVRADGKDRVTLDVQMFHSLQGRDKNLGLKLNLSQSLLPSFTNLQVNLAANVTPNGVSLRGIYMQGLESVLAQVQGSLKSTRGLHVAISGDLRHSLTNLAILPTALGFDGALGVSDCVIEGQIRVRVIETLYIMELKHLKDSGEEAEESTMGEISYGARDWLCIRSGPENFCVNVSLQLGTHGTGEVFTQLTHSLHLLNATGVPDSSAAKVRWVQDTSQILVFVEGHAGTKHLKAEFNGGRTNHLIPQWEVFLKLQNQLKHRSDSIQARAYYQTDTRGLETGLAIHIGDERMIDILFAVGSPNSTAVLVVSLWQQIKQLQGLIPSSLQMNCTGDATTDRLLAQCYGNVAGRPVEVRAFRSRRPHSRLCYGLSLIHFNFSAQAKGCLSHNGTKELRANLSHSSVPLLIYLGVPSECGLRLLVRPGPQRWVMGAGLVAGSRITDLSAGLRVERTGMYGWHGLLKYGSGGITHKAEVTGRLRSESWCHIWADVNGSWDSVSSGLLLAVRCAGAGRLAWKQVRRDERGEPHKTCLTVHGHAGDDGLKGSLGLTNHQDSLRCTISVLLTRHKVDAGGTFWHQWASLVSIIPNRVNLRGSAQLLDSSLFGSALISFNAQTAQIDVTASWKSTASLRVVLQRNLATDGLRELTVSLFLGAGQVRFEVESKVCSLFLLVNQERRGKRSSWDVFVQQQCGYLKTLLHPQTSLNVSVSRSGCSTNLSIGLQAQEGQNGALMVSLTCQPSLSLNASLQHSIDAVQRLGFPVRGAVVLNVSASQLPDVRVGLEFGDCHLSGNFENSKSSATEKNQFFSSLNVTTLCPALQGTVQPVALVIQGLVSVTPCQMSINTILRAGGQNLALELGRSCRFPHLSGTLTHNFSSLSSRGLAKLIAVEVTTPEGPEQAGALLIKAGTCHIRADRVMQARGRMHWLWTLQSKCPVFQTNLNGSMFREPQGMWTAVLDTDVKGQTGSLRLRAKGWPDLLVASELSHSPPVVGFLPEHSRVKLTGRAGKQQFVSDALIQMGECAVSVRGAVMTHPDLQGSLVYHNNCTVIQDLGCPDRLQAFGSMVVYPAFAESKVSMAMDDAELHALVALKKTKDQNEATLYFNQTIPPLKKLGLPVTVNVTIASRHHGNSSYYYLSHRGAHNQKLSQVLTVERMSEVLRWNSTFRHTLKYLETLGVPGDNSVQVEVGSSEGTALTLRSQLGDQQVGLKLNMKSLLLTKEMRGTVWHSVPWLRDEGVPSNMEGLCSIQGPFSQLRSRAQVTVDGHNLLAAGLNVSVAEGRLAALLSYSSPGSNQTNAGLSLSSALTTQFKGPLRSISADVNTHDWGVQVAGDVGGWGSQGELKEARMTLKHTIQGQSSPALHVEAWGRFAGSHLRCSVAVNPELSSSLALIVQAHRLPDSKDLMVKVVQNIPRLLVFLPPQLNVRSQLNQSQSSVGGLVEVLSGRRRLSALGELAVIESGYRQTLEFQHSYPQLKLVPRTVVVKTLYESRDWSYQVQHGALWGNHELSLSALYSAPPGLEMGNNTLKVQITCLPRLTSLDVSLERFSLGQLDSILLSWMKNGKLEQVRALSSWSRSEELNETRLELKHPFSSALSQLSVHTRSNSLSKEHSSSQQTHLSWLGTRPVNVSLSLSKQWQLNSSRGQACALLTTQQTVALPVKGCVSVGQEGNSYYQNAELRWDHRSFKQGMKYQKSDEGIHSLMVNIGLDNVSSAPCPSHTLLAKVQTNLKDRLDHTVVMGLCPPKPTLSWSGFHRLNSGEELLFTQSYLSVTGRPHQCSFTLALTNSSSAQRTNVSLFAESRMGNWSFEVGGSGLSWRRGSGLQLQARLDGREKIWMNGTMEGRCLQTTAGYKNGVSLYEVMRVEACIGKNHSLTLAVQRRDSSSSSSQPDVLGSLFMGKDGRHLILTARGCLESLTAVEAGLHTLSSQILSKLLERIKIIQQLLTEFRRQSTDSELLQELSAVGLLLSQQVEALLGHSDSGLLVLWQNSQLRHVVTSSLPRYLLLMEQVSLLGQQELKRPLATLAGVYQDVKGQRLEALWREAVLLMTDRLLEVVPALLENAQLRPLAQAFVATLGVTLDMGGQQTYNWVETRLAMALSGLRKRLASVYKYSPSECSVMVSVPLPQVHWSRVTEAGMMGVLLEEWILRPLRTLVSIRPTAEFYRLKRKIMDSPFIYQALLVADQFVVTFDGHLYELPASCPLLLAHDISADPSFTLVLSPDSQNLLLMGMNNSTISIQHNGEVKANCNNEITQAFHSDSGVTVRRGSSLVHISNGNGVSVSCDLTLKVCSLTLDGWLHGTSTGLLGTNDNEAGNDFALPDGSLTLNPEVFLSSWQMRPRCISPPVLSQRVPKVSCDSLFSSPDSPLSSCFRVVDPGQFLSVCEMSTTRAPCRLASAFVHLCQQNYIPLEVPVQCLKA